MKKAKNNFKVFRDTVGPSDLLALLITVVIYFIGWINLPTICSVPKGVEIKSGIFKNLYTFFLEYDKIYYIFMAIIMLLVSSSIYFIIKIAQVKKYKLFFYEDEINCKFIDFLDDAREVYIFGGDLDFLLEDSLQLEKIKKMGSRCKIICEDYKGKENETAIRKLYKELSDSKVQINNYGCNTEKLKDFRGQIKKDNQGVLLSLFVKKVHTKNGKRYEIVNFDNQYISDMLLNSFHNLYKSGCNPFIKYIAFDLGGVFFDGDFNADFLDPINSKLSQNILKDRNQKLMLDEDLNLGKSNICNFIEKKISRDLLREEKSYIKKLWQDIWKPNELMLKLVESLANNGYTVIAISNLDKENGDMYIERGDFKNFSKLFFSYEYKLLKPDTEFFNKILQELKIEPYELLFIDDHEQNTKIAEELGICAIQFAIKDDTTLKYLNDKLQKLNIIMTEKEVTDNTIMSGTIQANKKQLNSPGISYPI